MRGAGCTYNDIVDRHIDNEVARTVHGPFPLAAFQLNEQAFLVLQALLGLVVLTLCPCNIVLPFGLG